MEDILASIKKIIADGPAPGTGASAFTPAAVEKEESDEILELGEPLGEPLTEPEVVHASVASPAVGPKPSMIVSDAVVAASRQAFAALGTVSVDPEADPNSLDGLVRELLRPMLKAWLDENLPGIVERLVAREVARLGGR